jgi:hypothetical protein
MVKKQLSSKMNGIQYINHVAYIYYSCGLHFRKHWVNNLFLKNMFLRFTMPYTAAYRSITIPPQIRGRGSLCDSMQTWHCLHNQGFY